MGGVLRCFLCVLLPLPAKHREVLLCEIAKWTCVGSNRHLLQHDSGHADGPFALPQSALGERREGLLADAALGAHGHHASAGALCAWRRLLAVQGQLLGQQHARLLRDPFHLQRSHDGGHSDDDADAELGSHRASPAFGHRSSLPSIHVHRGAGRALHSHRPAIPCKFHEAAALQEVLRSGREPRTSGQDSVLLARETHPGILASYPCTDRVQVRPLRPILRV
mmetsp:Transcript_109481/g.153199  ORF Transcript_109481/g.153199 Transcript_109481/m.153199 type:complete len:223 (-) Transcript_109481:252-920(-)